MSSLSSSMNMSEAESFQAVSFNEHRLVSSQKSGSEILTYNVDIFRQPAAERHARAGDVVCFRPSPSNYTSGDTMPLGVLTWIEPIVETLATGGARMCEALEIFTKKRLSEMAELGDIDNVDDMGDDFEGSPGYTAWLSNRVCYWSEHDILTVPSMQETRYHVRFASFERYLNINDEAQVYRIQDTPISPDISST